MNEFRHFERADRILKRALELAPDEVASYVEAACADDGDLKQVVEGLLEAVGDEEALSPGGALSDRTLERIADELDREEIPPRIGVYRLLRELGRGGMAVVYLAERADGAYEQQVALKLIDVAGPSHRVERRFVQERQILAALNHPHIARLLDGGTADDGRPYLVMEHVDGVPIDRYCDERRLGVEDRLRLFLKVCAAVRYAHRNLVVHRDLKPTNILVTADGEPKLLDFGIAKLLETDATGDAMTQTRLHERPMTPQYASPEQILGHPITTATDVYALGLLLYELLTGRRAHRLASTESREVERAVCEDSPERPSTASSRTSREAGGDTAPLEPAVIAEARRLSPARLRRRLRGDLDNIVLKALRKEPERRYASVEELAGDVERHLEGLPVLAHGDSLLYRSRKLVRRRAGTLVAAALVLASLVTGLVVALLQARRAELEARRAEGVSEFLVELLEDADPDRAQGREISVQEVVERAARQIEVELADQPAVQATLETVMGRVYRQLGSPAEAEDLLASGLETRRALLGAEHVDVAASAEELARVLLDLGRWEEATALARESLAIRRRLLGAQHPEVASSLEALARSLYLQGDLQAARTALEEAVAVERSALGDGAPELADTLAVWANLEIESGDPREAERRARRALEIRRRTGPDKSRDLAAMLQVLAHALTRVGNPERLVEAEELLFEAIDVERALLGEDHPRIAFLLGEVAGVRAYRGDYTGGEEAYLEALRMLRESLGPDHPEVGVVLNNIAVFYHRQGKWPEAIDYYRRSIELRRQVLGEDHPLVGTTEAYLGLALHMAGDEAAEATYRSALDHLLQSRSPEHEKVGNLRNDLGRLLLEQGRHSEAEPHLRQALAILQPIFGDEDQRTDNARANLGYVLCRLGRIDEGEALLERSRAWRRNFYSNGHWTPAEADLFLAACLAETGRSTEARAAVQGAYGAMARQLPDEHPTVRLAERIRDRLATQRTGF